MLLISYDTRYTSYGTIQYTTISIQIGWSDTSRMIGSIEFSYLSRNVYLRIWIYIKTNKILWGSYIESCSYTYLQVLDQFIKPRHKQFNTRSDMLVDNLGVTCLINFFLDVKCKICYTWCQIHGSTLIVIWELLNSWSITCTSTHKH